MRSWKANFQVRDLSDTQRLEMVCRKCARLTYITKNIICTAEGRDPLYLDEVERRAKCKVRGCGGQMRMGMVRTDEMSGFIGGLA